MASNSLPAATTNNAINVLPKMRGLKNQQDIMHDEVHRRPIRKLIPYQEVLLFW